MSTLEQRITLCGRQTNPLFSEKLQQGQMKGKAKACAFEKKKKKSDLFVGKLQRLRTNHHNKNQLT